jgi:mRNA-degrading endonuclease HigB of HigAB toxin-antitoxin module
MNTIHNSWKLVWLAVFFSLMIGCKSAKKTSTATNAAAEKAKMEQEEALRKQKEEELKRKKAEEDRAKMDSDAAMKEMKESAPKVRLNEYFTAIANSPNVTSANSSITEALGMFASAETPVLIVISEEAGKKDYDRPTTIKAYLNYLKDQKKNINNIENVKLDDSGKITEVELKKIN